VRNRRTSAETNFEKRGAGETPTGRLKGGGGGAPAPRRHSRPWRARGTREGGARQQEYRANAGAHATADTPVGRSRSETQVAHYAAVKPDNRSVGGGGDGGGGGGAGGGGAGVAAATVAAATAAHAPAQIN